MFEHNALAKPLALWRGLALSPSLGLNPRDGIHTRLAPIKLARDAAKEAVTSEAAAVELLPIIVCGKQADPRLVYLRVQRGVEVFASAPGVTVRNATVWRMADAWDPRTHGRPQRKP